VYLDTHKDLL